MSKESLKEPIAEKIKTSSEVILSIGSMRQNNTENLIKPKKMI